MIFQDPMVSLNPLKTVGAQLRELLRHRAGMQGTDIRQRSLELLDMVGIANPADRLKSYAFELSGGDAPAGDDRHRAGLRTDASHRGRAHYGARRDHPGPDPHPAARPVGPSWGYRC